jgi:hypothetical protein
MPAPSGRSAGGEIGMTAGVSIAQTGALLQAIARRNERGAKRSNCSRAVDVVLVK